jgi:hypothetical protein
MLLSSNRLWAWAAVSVTAAALGFACSSSSSGQPFNAGGDDASGASSSGSGDAAGGDGGGGAPQDSSTPSVPCDASIVFPVGAAMGAACGQCLQAMCASDLAQCQDDCTCVSSIECLAMNADLYVMCPGALAAIGMGNPGLMALAACIVSDCNAVCNQTD